MLHPDAGLGGMASAVRISWWQIPIPKNKTASNPSFIKALRPEFQDLDHENQWAWKNLLPWENGNNFSTRAVSALGPAWTSPGVSLRE